MTRPIVICCSQYFKPSLEIFVKFLQDRGIIVFYPNFRRHSSKLIKKPEEERLKSSSYSSKVPGLVFAHFHNLEMVHSMGGVCLIFNPGPKLEGKQKKRRSNKVPKFGYVGSNTQGEIGGCVILKMPILLLRPHREKWIMTVSHEKDLNRVFANKFPEKDPMEDLEFLYENWLRNWLGAPSSAPVKPISAPPTPQ